MINFIQDIENMSFNDACAHIEGRTMTMAVKVPVPSSFDKVDLARRIWDRSGPIAGTPAERYLESRGISLDTICPQHNLRFGMLSFDGSAELHSAMIAAVRDVRGEITGIQRTFLTNDGEKLCKDAKRSLGNIRGGAVRLSSGEEVGDFSQLYICEGVEDGLSILRVNGDAAVWATAGAGMMQALILPESCRSVRIVPDNDVAGRRAAQALGEKLTRQGRFVMFNRLSDDLKDYNEYLLHLLAERQDASDGNGEPALASDQELQA